MCIKKTYLIVFLITSIASSGFISCGGSGSGGEPVVEKPFTITYNGNMNISGSVPVDNQIYASGQTAEILDNTGDLINWGYTWSGWNTEPDGRGTAYSVGQTIDVSESITLYAQWETTASGLAGEWLFNGDADDTSGNDNNGTVTGAILTDDRFGETNKAYYFDGFEDLIEVSDSTSLDLTTGATISLWVYFDETNVSCNILNKENAYSIGLNDTSNLVYNWHGDAGGSVFGETLSTGSWHHIVTYFDGDYTNGPTGHARWYLIDGVIIIGSDVDGDIGTSNNNLTFGNLLYHGRIDDVRIYNRSLPRDEIQAIYHEREWDSTLPGTDDLAGEWRFTGGSLNDTSGSENAFVNYGAALAPDRFGNSNCAYTFNAGNANYMTTTGYTNLPTGNANRTVTAWIKIDSFTADSYTPIVCYGDCATSGSSYMIGIDNSEHKIFFGPGGSVSTPGSVIEAGVWYHVAILNTGNDVRFYLNGHIDDHGSTPITINTTAGPLTLGWNTVEEAYFNGVIDDVRIYNRALSGSEIYALAHLNGE